MPRPPGFDHLPDAGDQPCWHTIGVWGTDTPRCPELPRVVHCRNCEVYHAAGRTMFDRRPPPDHGADWAAAVAEAPADDEGLREPALVFLVAGERLALPLSCVVEVLEWRTIRSVPHRRHDALLGLVNIRGELQLCASLEVLFGGERPHAVSPSPRGRLLAVGLGSIEWVLPVDEVLGLPQVRVEALDDVPVTLFKSSHAFVRGLFRFRDEPAGLLDGEMVLGALRRRLT